MNIKCLRAWTLLIVLIMLGTNCTLRNRVNIIKNGDVSADRKTIFTPVGTGDMLGIVKQILTDKKWSTVALKGPARTTGAFDAAKVDISQYNEATANYILYLNSTFVGFQHCAPNFESYAGVPLTAGYSYSVSIVDWKTGGEVVAIGGGGCLYDILPILMDNIP